MDSLFLEKAIVLSNIEKDLSHKLEDTFNELLRILFKNKEDIYNKDAVITKEVSDLLVKYHSLIIAIDESSLVKRSIESYANYPTLVIIDGGLKLTLNYRNKTDNHRENLDRIYAMESSYMFTEDNFKNIPVVARLSLIRK